MFFGLEFTWLTVVMMALTGFFGAGVAALWKQDHRFGAGVLAALALVCLAMAVVSVIPSGAS